jgi:hypothetical protein
MAIDAVGKQLSGVGECFDSVLLHHIKLKQDNNGLQVCDAGRRDPNSPHQELARMKTTAKFSALSALTIALLLAPAGCKSNNQANNQNNPQTNPQSNPQAESQSNAQNPQPQAPPPPSAVDLPAGTHLRVRLDEDLGSKISQPGETFHATLADDLVVNGRTVIRRGARAEGTVVDAKPLGHFKGGAELVVRLDRVHTQWGAYPVETSSVERAEKGKGKRTAEFAGGGGAFGAIVGGLAGGGRGAVIGALAGGGAGTAGGAFTGNKQIVLPAETLLTFRLERSVHVVEGQ